jgi:hypothetical protein
MPRNEGVKKVSGLLWASPVPQMYCFAHPHISWPNPQYASVLGDIYITGEKN